jgi:hypothetical protein
MRGIELTLANEPSNYLSVLLGNVDLCKYNWIIAEQEIHQVSEDGKMGEEGIFKTDALVGQEFLSVIRKYDRPYFVIKDGKKIDQGILLADALTGQEFLSCISNFDKYYMIFAFILAYPVNSPIGFIKNYGDYLTSNCEMIFLCADTTWAAIYCKDSAVLEQIQKICDGDKIAFSRFITDENDNIRFS